jgi:pyruvate ferredoxin oxidoreductase gamma subunit
VANYGRSSRPAPDAARAPPPQAGQVFEVRIHGRGGQGVVTAAELLSVAAFDGGAHAQAFPSFGSERTGAPVVAFCRISPRPIRTREPIAQPDALIVQDPTLLGLPDVMAGTGPTTLRLVNSSEPMDGFITVPATELAREHLGRPLPNAALLGAFAAASGVVELDAVCEAIRERFSGPVGEGNCAAARAAHAHVMRNAEVAAC